MVGAYSSNTFICELVLSQCKIILLARDDVTDLNKEIFSSGHRYGLKFSVPNGLIVLVLHNQMNFFLDGLI
jgi:hypothetical protein